MGEAVVLSLVVLGLVALVVKIVVDDRRLKAEFRRDRTPPER